MVGRFATFALAGVALMALPALTSGAGSAEPEPRTCAEADASADYAVVYVAGPSGQVVTVIYEFFEAEWPSAMVRAVGTDMTTLEALIGVPMPFDELAVLQTTRARPLGLPTDLEPEEPCLRVHDVLDDRPIAATALARLWFNEATVADAWLREGLAHWAAHRVTRGSCPASDPASDPATTPALADWTELTDPPTEAELERLDAQAAAACSIVHTIAERAGPWRMTAALNAFATDAPAYGAAPPLTARAADAGPSDWRDWLDAVDELALIRADEPDLEYAERLLIEHGAITADQVAGRAEARALYHEALDTIGADALPTDVPELMDGWHFEEARAAIEASR